MGLDLDGVPLIDEEELQGEVDAQALTASLKEYVLQTLGISEVPKPLKDPTPLSEFDITAITNDQLNELYKQYVAYTTWIGTKLSEHKAAYYIADSNLDRLKARLKSELADSGKKAAQIEYLYKLHPLLQRYEVDRLKSKIIVDLITANFEAYDSQAKALSRTIEIRKLEFEQTRRQENAPRRGPGLGVPSKTTLQTTINNAREQLGSHKPTPRKK